MNKYPLWKYALIVVALVVSLLYAAPNLFGEVPAVQVAGIRASTKVDAAMQAAIVNTPVPTADNLALRKLYFS